MIIRSDEEMQDFGEKFARSAPKVIELIGDVGAGKTTFVKGLALGLGVTEEVTSPSFVLSKRYKIKDGELIHYDFYRLKEPGLMADEISEALENPQNIIIVEWAESVENLLPKTRQKIEIKILDENSRELIL
ncbi:tRNA (adenosine(37)-N6)-threonylcarbamoyltransferase complex ATPase subunit type 1 TsaE [Candidatus Saccharibacteria bacterium]|nr:tRNA (adenosine(37)-N6)-threonylcarbamoyltransferase complex ATPase subunit type 1 TsaE [Candidatus Saccharibacteria bacterium]